jgi:hypothetical protein
VSVGISIAQGFLRGLEAAQCAIDARFPFPA